MRLKISNPTGSPIFSKWPVLLSEPGASKSSNPIFACNTSFTTFNNINYAKRKILIKIDILLVIVSHLILISIGLFWFNKLHKRLHNKFTNPPIIQLFLIFCIYGGLALIILHSLTWVWSGMASIGIFAAILIAPLVGLSVSYSLRTKRIISNYHRIIFILGLIYIPASGVLLAALFFMIKE